MKKIKEKFNSKYNYNYRFHLIINKFSIIMLPPKFYGYKYELYDLKKKKIIDRYDSIIKAIDKIKLEIKKNKIK